jgi:hypothetical protein
VAGTLWRGLAVEFENGPPGRPDPGPVQISLSVGGYEIG